MIKTNQPKDIKTQKIMLQQKILRYLLQGIKFIQNTRAMKCPTLKKQKKNERYKKST